MRRFLLSLAIVGGGLASAGPLRAGVYNLDPPSSIYRSEFHEATQPNADSFTMRLADLRGINEQTPQPGRLRAGYRRQADELEVREKADALSPEDRVNLSACLIRLGRLDRARTVLEKAERVVPVDHPAHFLILLNLASAYQDNAELLPRAIDLQTRALDAWPDMRAGWSLAESDWYRRVETFVLRLMNLRQGEARSAGGRPRPYETVDAVFAGVRFLGSKDRYEAGTIAFDMRNKLPRDAESIAIQMALWRPEDDRLYWLVGELLNARGDIETAYTVFDKLVYSRQHKERELLAHRNVLRGAQDEFKTVQEFIQQPAKWEQLLWAMAPRGSLLTPGLGSAANETAWVAALHLASPPLPSSPPSSPATATPSSVLPDWRHVTISFLTGMVVAVLGALQWQQWRPRKDGARPA
ncbi:MAG TPA: tetratricopeptide repeat protein [Gemmataceae bacterium]|nr:tetratricopeptide repeat protein [Gemmataceae bacterium]